MKNAILLLSLFVSFFCSAQQNIKGEVKNFKTEVTALSIKVDFESLEELEEFNPEDLRESLKNSDPDEDVTFKMEYNYPESIKNGKSTTSFSFAIGGKAEDVDQMILSITELKKRAINVVTAK